MSLNLSGGQLQGCDKLADRSSLPPASGEEKVKPLGRHVFREPHAQKGGMGCVGREETEGSSGSSVRTPSSGDAAPYLRWARTLHDLLEDAEGVRLFRTFVESAGGLHLDRLNFYFAVRGLRHEAEPAKIQQVVGAIYKFLRRSQLTIPEELRARVKQGLRDGGRVERTIFDAMEHEVTRTIMETTYQAFLRSDSYVSYVSAATQPLSSPDSGSPSAGKDVYVPSRELATLHEGQELNTAAPPPPAARLTRDMLMATQGRRAFQSDLPSGVFGRKYSVYSHHLSYAAYTPASRQDSERGSLSSGRTDNDVISISGSSVDGMSSRCREPPRSHRPRVHGMDRHAVINTDLDTPVMIPRTLRPQMEQLKTPLTPEQFAPLLIEKLEQVRRDRELKDKLDRKLLEGDSEDMIPPQMVAAAIREKLQLDDDNDQDILDQHVSRVWSERTPGASPPGGRRARPPRRRAPSTLSADSGLCEAGSDCPAPATPAPAHARRKKPVSEVTDSGVSVVSEGAPPPVEPRILQWIQEGCSSSDRYNRRSYLSSRASSAERRRGCVSEGDSRHHQRSRGSSSKTSSGGGASAGAGAGAGGTADACTVVVVSFLDEQVPYRIKVPAAPLTLRLFKDYLPRKGNYRYFFKTECAELDNTVIQEEVVDDAEVLPLLDGKVMARVKSVE